ncbi:hypothetical protein CEXT_583041 [Caerostris extrusa]|uniref:CHAT domain-containing protein n=1 Tax=Caerostris extrusa TaxID=172846 RepID=A0AAV4QKC0_CAEEX|nr:hypothetical protein CEXT_583041 [Caerostris extrusa]
MVAESINNISILHKQSIQSIPEIKDLRPPPIHIVLNSCESGSHCVSELEFLHNQSPRLANRDLSQFKQNAGALSLMAAHQFLLKGSQTVEASTYSDRERMIFFLHVGAGFVVVDSKVGNWVEKSFRRRSSGKE